MPMITFEGHDYECNQDETILESLTRHGLLIPSSCQSGVCQTCLSKAVKGTPPKEAQKGLKDTLAAQNYFLACICKPTEDMTLASANSMNQPIVGTLIEKTVLNETVVRLRLKCDAALDYKAGQFVNVEHPESHIVRSYSLASLPKEDFLELHVKRVPEGRMSGYLHDSMQVGESVSIMGPAGDCFYTDRDLTQPILMVGLGTGLAPLYGVARDALQQGHTGEIHIFHGSLAVQGLYYMNELYDLSEQFNHVTYTPCVMHGDVPKDGVQGDIQQILKAQMNQLKGWRVYVCGDPAIVKIIKQHCFMSGASMADIYSDPFVFSPE